MRRVLRRTVLFALGSLILRGKLERAADLFDEAREFFGGLGSDGLDVALEDEEILGLDEDIVLDEGFVVRRICDGPFIQLVLRGASCRDAMSLDERPSQIRVVGCDVRPLKEPLLLLFILKHSENPGLLGRALALAFVLFVLLLRQRTPLSVIPGQTAAPVHEISKLATSELRALHTEDKRDGIHEIGLARAIGPDDGREIPERADDLVSPCPPTGSAV
jgi:hypothetical protein